MRSPPMGWTPLHLAAVNGHVDAIKLLVNQFKADAKAKSNDGWTLLHQAARNGHVDVVKLFVNEFRADANTQSNDGRTPLHMAAQNGHVEVVRSLMEFGADANVEDMDDVTPLYLAAYKGHVEVAKLTLSNARDKDGLMPLYRAVGLHIHPGRTCDGCLTRPIIEERYKCTACADFNFCSSCHGTVDHDHRHVFRLVKPPTLDVLKVAGVHV